VLQRPMWSAKLDTLPAPASGERKYLVAFVSRNCLDVYRSQNGVTKLSRTDEGHNPSTNLGWTCSYGRKDEWRAYNKRKELVESVDSMHDMICTIKQQAFLRYQLNVMKDRGIPAVAVDYLSFATLPHFVEDHLNASRRGDGKDILGGLEG
jgi:hypothetical protein